MGLYIDQGNSNFRETLNSRFGFVDKSGLLSHLNRMLCTDQKFVCVTRPRRFGKSLAAQMLCAYYDRSCDSHELFEHLEIAKDETFETHLNKYPVISFDVQEARSRVKNGIDFVPMLQEKIGAELRKCWPSETAGSVTIQEMMDHINEKTGTQFVVCLDEWHSIYRMDEDNEKAQETWIEFLRALFKGPAAKRYIALAYMTGVLPIRNYASESPLNNFYEYNVFDTLPFESYYGFTLEEVKSLCHRFDMDFDEMKRWYDGYRFDVNPLIDGKRVKRSVSISNPNSVVQAILGGCFQCYWNNTGALKPVENYIKLNVDGVKDAIVRMIAGESCRFRQVFFNKAFNSKTSYDSIMTMLTHLGYINYNSQTGMGHIPNEEIREAMYQAAESNHWDGVLRSIEASEKFIDHLIHGDEVGVAAILDKIHCELASILTFNDENTLACVVMYACYTARRDFFVFRELPSGVGFVDIALIPLPSRGLPAVLVELKWDKTADTAIKQIYNRKYTSAFDDYQGEIVLVGVNYNKESKDKMHECKIERVVKGQKGNF